MGDHDAYGRIVLREAAGNSFRSHGPDVEIDYGSRAPARIDGAVGSIAVEVESRTGKQVRGAVLDLLCHRYRKRLLLVLPVHMKADVVAVQCKNIFRRFIDTADFRVLVLSGSGTRSMISEDALLVRQALQELGWSPPA
jgi:hypothetical protein